MKQNILFPLLLFFSVLVWGQKLPQLSKDAQISVITCGSSQALYSSFGHTAFRVQDPTLGLDVVYNYGTFDFDKPNFYTNFAKGKLVYSLSRRSFQRFLFAYEYEKRWVKEQILNISTAEANALFRFFEHNYLPENRDYLYDPLFNNCSNITTVILKKQFGNTLDFKADHLPTQYTFRELVRQYIPINSWGSFGIELAFGGVTDRVATVEEHMFMPYYAMRQLRNTTKNGQALIKRERTILDYPETQQQEMFTTSPLFWFLVVLAFVIAITYLDFKHGSRNRWLDFTLFFFSGLTGLGIVLLWLATDHLVTQQNFNFLWLLPTNAMVAFYLFKNPTSIYWLRTYIWFALVGMGVIFIIWILGMQILSPLNIFLMLMLFSRYLLLLKRTQSKKSPTA